MGDGGVGDGDVASCDYVGVGGAAVVVVIDIAVLSDVVRRRMIEVFPWTRRFRRDIFEWKLSRQSDRQFRIVRGVYWLGVCLSIRVKQPFPPVSYVPVSTLS